MTITIDNIHFIRHNRRIMKLTNKTTDEAIHSEMGTRLAKLRLDRHLSQANLAELAGISKRTVERLESGAVSAQFSSIIRICRALDLIEQLDALFPKPLPSPIALLKQRGKQRRRATPKKNTPPSSPKWTWGDKS